jgi:hypothetical protein
MTDAQARRIVRRLAILAKYDALKASEPDHISLKSASRILGIPLTTLWRHTNRRFWRNR